MKICKDCKHFGSTSPPRPLGPACYAVVARVNIIYGHNEYYSCDHARNDKNICGLEAKLFEPSEKRKLLGIVF